MTVASLRPSRLPELELRTPGSIAELTELSAAGYRVYAGGSDVLLEAAHTGAPRRLAATAGVPEMARVDHDGDRIMIGGSVVLGRLLRDERLRSSAPALIDGAGRIGSVQLRNTATLVGNLCTASPAGDTIPGLLVHRAVVDTIDEAGTSRAIAVGEFVTGPGRIVLGPGEIVVSVTIDRLGEGEGSAYRRFTERKAIDLAFASVAARVLLEADGDTVRSVELALGAVGPTVIDASEAGAKLSGRVLSDPELWSVGDAAAELSSPITDHRCSADYRRQLVRVLTVEVVGEAVDRARRNLGSER